LALLEMPLLCVLVLLLLKQLATQVWQDSSLLPAAVASAWQSPVHTRLQQQARHTGVKGVIERC
jgi:hypothetical protein